MRSGNRWGVVAMGKTVQHRSNGNREELSREAVLPALTIEQKVGYTWDTTLPSSKRPDALLSP